LVAIWSAPSNGNALARGVQRPVNGSGSLLLRSLGVKLPRTGLPLDDYSVALTNANSARRASQDGFSGSASSACAIARISSTSDSRDVLVRDAPQQLFGLFENWRRGSRTDAAQQGAENNELAVQRLPIAELPLEQFALADGPRCEPRRGDTIATLRNTRTGSRFRTRAAAARCRMSW